MLTKPLVETLRLYVHNPSVSGLAVPWLLKKGFTYKDATYLVELESTQGIPESMIEG